MISLKMCIYLHIGRYSHFGPDSDLFSILKYINIFGSGNDMSSLKMWINHYIGLYPHFPPGNDTVSLKMWINQFNGLYPIRQRYCFLQKVDVAIYRDKSTNFKDSKCGYSAI